MGTVRVDISGLRAMQRFFAGKATIQVGVFGNKTTRAGKGNNVPTNAEIGAIHEFGSFSRHIPARSWLRAPLARFGFQIMDKINVAFKNAMTKGQPMLFWQQLGVAAENVIDDAFATSGWGSWSPDKPATVRAKGSSKPLIDHAELRRSVASRVVKK